MRRTVIPGLLIALGLVGSYSVSLTETPMDYVGHLAVLWLVVVAGTALSLWLTKPNMQEPEVALASTATAESEEDLLADSDNGILSSLYLGDKESSTIFQWLKISGWAVSANQMHNRIVELQRMGYIARTDRAYQITEEGRNRLIRDRARRLGTQVHLTDS